jgi:hypothetical protein
MTHLESCKRAATELGVMLQGPATVIVQEGHQVVADMLVVHFGAPEGTLVFTDAEAYLPHLARLRDIGYAVSSYAEPCEHLTSNDLREMLLDWTWCGPEALRPPWA